jgi:hypothetical protein
MKKSSYKNGDLVTIVSPYFYVTNDGYLKKMPEEVQYATEYRLVSGQLERESTQIPYGSICMIVDSIHGTVMFNKMIVMIPKNSIKKI